MWMMGCNDGGEICLPTNNDSFSSGRKLRLLIPRPPPNHSTNSPNHHHHHGHHGCGHQNHGRGARNPDHHGLFALNHHHHLATMAEQSKREFNAAHQVVVSSRWNPTPEQLRVLEEMYRQGTRTPSADQIQQITSQLCRYGKIEGKNVFYWFQNHKARERQKRRRQMESCGRAEEEKGHLNSHRETGNLQCKESGACCKTASDEVQRANNNNNNTPKDNSNNSYNWEAAEGSNIDKGGKSAMAGGGGSASASSSATTVKATSTSSASSTAVVTSLWMKLNDTRELLLPNSNLIITGDSMTNYDNMGRNAMCPRLLPRPGPVVLPTSTRAGQSIFTALHSSSQPLPFPSQDFQTLQLFPLRSEEYEEDRVCYVGEDDHLHRQFLEFLPMKN